MFNSKVCKICVLVWFASSLPAKSLYLPGAKTDANKAEEIQNAVCSIISKDIEATANATITRQLKGVCTSNELNMKIENLQTKILQEIDGIRYILEKNGFKVPDLHNKQSDNNTSDLVYDDINDSFVHDVEAPLESVIPKPLLKNANKLLPRIDEILRFNDTLIESDEGSKYFYYWKIDNVVSLLAKREMYISSPNFLVLGHNLHLQFYPNYGDVKYFAILLKPESSGFLKKHKLCILNHDDPGLDLVSGILYSIKSEDRMLKVSEENLDIKGFIVENSLVIRLEIFLDS